MFPPSDTISGDATASGGTGLMVGDTYVILHGIKSPSPKLQCFNLDKNIPCIAGTTKELSEQIEGRQVTCERIHSRVSGIPTARCFADGLDLSGHLVKTGWAKADLTATDEYLSLEVSARREFKGIWYKENKK